MREDELRRLKELLAACASGAADRGTREEADRLLSAAVAAGAVRPGLAAAEVRALLGEPHLAYGGEGEEEFAWGYLSRPRPGERPAEWYAWLEFRNGVLSGVGRRAWLAG